MCHTSDDDAIDKAESEESDVDVKNADMVEVEDKDEQLDAKVEEEDEAIEDAIPKTEDNE